MTRTRTKRSRLQEWRSGDLFLIPLSDGSRVFAQIIAPEPLAMNSVSIALFDVRIPAKSDPVPLPVLESDCVISVLLATRDLLDLGAWVVVGNIPVSIPPELRPYELTRNSGFVGASITGSKNVRIFLEAFYGLYPWNGFFDPAYFDGLLISPSKKPQKLVFK